MKIISWNIKADLPTALVPWNRRKDLLRDILVGEHANVYCLQEALKHQLDFLMEGMPGYAYVGVGRDDGKEKGEYCPIIYNAAELNLISSGTFWLSDTPDVPSKGYDTYPRICTWAVLKSVSSGKIFGVYNTHFPLVFHVQAKKKAAQVFVQEIKKHGIDRILITGDFNAGPASVAWRQVIDAGFLYAGDERPTAHMLTIPTMCIDGIFISKQLHVVSYNRIHTHRGFLYPSDHYGITANIS